jgi:hypothetical protein
LKTDDIHEENHEEAAEKPEKEPKKPPDTARSINENVLVGS